MNEERVCSASDCEVAFAPKRQNQKFHSRECGIRERNRGRAKFDVGAPSEQKTLDDQLADSRRRDQEQAHRQELRKLTAAEERLRRYERVLTDCLTAYEPTPLVADRFRPAKGAAKLPEHELILCTGDWHTGMKTKIHETGGVYEQDVETTRQQVFKLWEKVQRLTEIETGSIRHRKLHLLGLGDLVDNDDMRPSQHRQVEDVVTVQTVQAFDLWTWLIRQCLTLFEEVEVDMVGGNHDRTGQRRGNAGLGELDYADTFSYLIGAFAQRLFADEPRVRIRNWNTFFGYKEVAGQRVVFEHGSSFKWNANSYAGIPWYAVSMLPKRYAEMLGPPDLTIFGHGHRPAVLPSGDGWLIANGALPATSNYEQSSFKSVHRPLQWLLSLHEEHGLVKFEPLYLDVPGTLKAGEIWEDPEHYAALANERKA